MNTDMILAFSTLIVPLFDVVRVVVHRLREKKNPFLPDQNHFHHKLLRTGIRVRTVMVTILCVSLFLLDLIGYWQKRSKRFGYSLRISFYGRQCNYVLITLSACIRKRNY